MRLFGTDGIRGKANRHPITAEIAMKFGMAAGAFLKNGSHQNRVIIAKDTRLSGYLLEPALTAGFIAVGVDVILVGPMPTPAVPMLIRSLKADFGVMITASHNPHDDNGFKLFNRYAQKISDDSQNKVEQLILSESLNDYLAYATNLGRARRLEDAPGRYIEFVKSAFPKNLNLEGLRIVADCANGAAYRMAPTILWELGAEVIETGCRPNGFNINENCGAMHPKQLGNRVRQMRADIGIALDGDGDRVLICDENGRVLDGDRLICAIAKHMHEMNKLKGKAIVATQMSNMGMEEYLQDIGLKVLRAQVGDRYVAAVMQKHKCNFGGEQSGHIIFSDYTTTGDGTLAALQTLALIKQNNIKVSELHGICKLYPQTIYSVAYDNHNPLEDQDTQEEIAQISNKYAEDARLIVRKSGTEKVIRVMVEGKDRNIIDQLSQELRKIISTA